MISQARLREAVRHFGWGPRTGTVVFYRNDIGWQLGNGTVLSPWLAGTPIPHDPEQALRDIERRNARLRR